jgi:hypothetical protein
MTLYLIAFIIWACLCALGLRFLHHAGIKDRERAWHD